MSAREVRPLAFPSDAALSVPGSKSEANRLLVIAALSQRRVVVHGASPTDDVRHLVRGLGTLGYEARFVDEGRGTVQVGPRAADAPTRGELFCGNAGTAVRFLVSVAAVTPGEWIVTGDAHMQKRPIQPLVDAWRRLGVDLDARGGCPPVRVRGGLPDGGDVSIDGSVSSQFVSSLLMVGAALPAGLRASFEGSLASRSYAQLTVSLLHRFGIDATLTATHARVARGYGDVPAEVQVGGDWSGMGAWSCLGHLDGSRVRSDNLVQGSGQADEALGAVLDALRGPGERTIDVEPLPDQFLNLAVVAALRDGTTRLVGAHNVRVKECDRVAVMARELRRCGADLDEHADGLTIRGGRALHGATIDPEADHRVAMAFALLGSLVPGVSIDDPGCVAKSYPTFWDDLDAVHAQHRPVALVGMRGAGKTTLGRALAQHLGSRFVDTDQRFVAAHGDLAAFVAAHGWPAFREVEQGLVADALQAGCVVATGGGAIESDATRDLLRTRACVVYVEAPLELLQQRVRGSGRPSLTGAPIDAEVEPVLARRAPLYRSIAHRTVDATLAADRQLAAALRRRP
jgi:3-phosphoshikimate 1-carboxyvinyltransferase